MSQYMLLENIIKFSVFVLLISLLSLFTANCAGVFPNDVFRSNSNGTLGDAERSKDYAAPKVVGHLQDDVIDESSGIAASRCNTGVYWTHNDSGDDAFLYGFDLKGEKLGVWRVPAAKNIDWEDIAEFKDKDGKCFLYVSDTGNNKRERGQLTIYKVPEPQVSPDDKDSTKSRPVWTSPADEIKIEYPDSRYDAETLMVHPQTGDIYVMTKSYTHEALIYKLVAPYDPEKVNTMKQIGTMSVPAFPNGTLTGGDISPDGKRAVICDYFNAYEFILPDPAKNFDEIWKQKPQVIELGPRKTGESIAYSADGKFIIAGSEGKNSPLIVVDRK
jgi:hypothetical protein